jgi:elongation factor G
LKRSVTSGEGEEAKTTELEPSPDAPLAAVVFKVATDPFVGKLSYFRVLSGTLQSDTNFFVGTDRKGIRAGHIFKPMGKQTEEVQKLTAGDIGSLAKVEQLQYGLLMHDGKLEGKLPLPPFPKPMYSLALTPKKRGDEQKISGALSRMSEEDPCFQIGRDPQTHEMVVSALGDLHLRVALERMKTRFNLEVETSPPKIPYRETITTPASHRYRHKKQSGGAGQFAEVEIKVEPLPRGSDPTLEWSWDIFGGAIPSNFEQAVQKGVSETMEQGAIAGYPLQDVKVSVIDGKHHPVDSKDIAFRIAGRHVMAKAVEAAKPVILEPIVSMEITIPNEYMGDITGDINGKRGRVIGMDALPGGLSVIRAEVPLAEVLQYNAQLKSATGGQGSYSMEFSHYEPVPSNIQQQIIAASKPREEEE